MKPKTDAERRYDAAKAALAAAEKAASAAERITASHPAKLETLNRRIRDLKNTTFHGTDEQNSRSNRDAKLSDLEGDKAKLEAELTEARSALRSARGAAQTARQEESQAAAAFTMQADRARLDAETKRTELAVQSHELAERKFAQSEKAAADAAQATLEKARQDGETAERISNYEWKAKAAQLQFEFQQRREMQAIDAENRASEIAATNQGNLDLAQLQGQIAERASQLNHGQALEIIKANEISDIGRIVATAEQHRLNVTHETNEDIRKAVEFLQHATQKGASDTMNAMKLLVLKSYLKRQEMREAQKIAREARAEDLDSLAADMDEIARWNEQKRREAESDG